MDFVRRARPLLETYVRWFRPEVWGFDRLPDHGPFLVVGNHSGGLSAGLPTLQLPARVVVQLLDPIDLRTELGTDDADDPAVLSAGYDLVTTTMQETLSRLAAERPGQRWLG